MNYELLNIKPFILLLIFAWLTSTCSNSSYTVNENGITVVIGKPATQSTRLVRILVLSDDIFRVSATPEKVFTDKKSLCVIMKSGV